MSRIKNFDALNRTPLRADALAIVDAAYDAIDTAQVIREKLQYEAGMLRVDGKEYDLSQYARVRLLGFGKASCKAVQTVEEILREHITEGIAIDVHPGVCEVVTIAQGTHPHPSVQNVTATEKLVHMAKESTEDDLVIVVVSGGGSSLLCWPQEDCDQGIRFFDEAAMAGAQIGEMNIVRRHLSQVKGGGLAEILYPATVLGLVFCDVPGDVFQDVASGPTYFDETTIADAEAVLQKYGLSGYTLRETPKDRSVFEKVHNVEMISNGVAVSAMHRMAEERGYRVIGVGTDRYDEPLMLIESMREKLEDLVAVLAGGEVRIEVTQASGKGGRCAYIALEALNNLGEHDVFVAFASDGTDNSDAAGVIADRHTVRLAEEKNQSISDHLERFDAYGFFEGTGDLLFTGKTDSNVSDLYFVLRRVV